MKFAIGDKVVEKVSVQAHTSYHVSEVAGTLNGALLIAPWGDSFQGEVQHYGFLNEYTPGSRVWREAIQRFQEAELFSLEEAEAERQRLEAAHNNLEQEFEAIKDQVHVKLAAAAQFAEEATALLAKHKKTFEDVVQDCVPLYKALKQGGWRHSTLQCKVG